MTKTTAKVQYNQLYVNEGAASICAIGSSTWFDLLETATAFRYFSQERQFVAHNYSRPLRPISVRKEKRRRGYLWYAYLRTHGQLHKRYVGKSVGLTTSRLDEIALILNQIW